MGSAFLLGSSYRHQDEIDIGSYDIPWPDLRGPGLTNGPRTRTVLISAVRHGVKQVRDQVSASIKLKAALVRTDKEERRCIKVSNENSQKKRRQNTSSSAPNANATSLVSNSW